MTFLKLLIPAALACLCNALANTVWKLQFDKKPLTADSFSSFTNLISTFFTPNIIGGIIFYICSMLLFFYMLSNFKLSAIIPITCLTYVFNIAVAVLIFQEKISHTQAIGTGVIIIGLIVLSRA